jgi:hypothetical protein
MIKSIGDNDRIYGLIIVEIAKKIISVRLFEMPLLSHLTMILPMLPMF